jgi:hypothetical protein
MEDDQLPAKSPVELKDKAYIQKQEDLSKPVKLNTVGTQFSSIIGCTCKASIAMILADASFLCRFWAIQV